MTVTALKKNSSPPTPAAPRDCLQTRRAAILRAYDVPGTANGILHASSLILTTNPERVVPVTDAEAGFGTLTTLSKIALRTCRRAELWNSRPSASGLRKPVKQLLRIWTVRSDQLQACWSKRCVGKWLWRERGGRNTSLQLSSTTWQAFPMQVGVDEQSEEKVSKGELPVMRQGVPNRQREENWGGRAKNSGSKECHQEGWSKWQPTGKEGVDLAIRNLLSPSRGYTHSGLRGSQTTKVEKPTLSTGFCGKRAGECKAVGAKF